MKVLSIERQFKASQKEISNLKAALDEHAIVAITDPQGRITYVNDKFCEISKYSRDELLGQDHRIINSGYHPKAFMRDLWSTISQGQVWKGEIRNRAKDGSYYWVDTTVVPFLDDDGKPYQCVAIRTDITKRIRAEEEVRRMNEELAQRVHDRTAQLEAANLELESFSYSVSHDLRAPLRHIEGFTGLLAESLDTVMSAKARHYIAQITSSARDMGQLIEDLLVFSRTGRSEMRKSRVSLQGIAQEMIGNLKPDTEGRDIVWKLGPLPEVQADGAMLRQVFANLLSNAIKYTRNRPRAEIEIGCAEDPGREIVIYVRDNGAGFDMRYVDKLFGVFQRLHLDDEFEGSGIGLANVRRIVNRHGGRTWAEGKVDAGATFYFSLPLAPGEP